MNSSTTWNHTTENVKDPNFGGPRGHRDEINPSASTNFYDQPYNRHYENMEIPSYDPLRDSTESIKREGPIRLSGDPDNLNSGHKFTTDKTVINKECIGS